MLNGVELPKRQLIYGAGIGFALTAVEVLGGFSVMGAVNWRYNCKMLSGTAYTVSQEFHVKACPTHGNFLHTTQYAQYRPNVLGTLVCGNKF
jgi:hypothetical protein